MAKSNKDIKKLILNFINLNPLCSSKEIHEDLKNDFAYATIKRAIQLLLAENLITVSGNGKSTKYEISEAYELIRFVDVDEYFQKEIDERDIKNNFNHSLIAET
jgi:predicted transcriptional regulator